jgi:alkylation response protein AidB-like acyl-CoA dehydrogenase
MADFVADIRDIKFVLFEQLDMEKLLATERYGCFTKEDVSMIIDQAYKMAREVLGPVNAKMDQAGCTFKDGKVTVPACFHEPFKMFNEGGWQALNHSAEYGGQGAPDCLMIAACDLFFGSNISFNLGALLTTGAAHLVEEWGTEEIKNIYCAKMYGGQWAGTMCLTEAGAGSDVGASKTKAHREGDHFLIEGEKIFITFGDHDLTENVVHAVLARIDGAPKGTAGLSLFVVPKFRVNPDGSVGEFNDVHCSNIEHKLGIHGSPTCELQFNDAPAELCGQRRMGLFKYVMSLMNGARLGIAAQGGFRSACRERPRRTRLTRRRWSSPRSGCRAPTSASSRTPMRPRFRSSSTPTCA